MLHRVLKLSYACFVVMEFHKCLSIVKMFQLDALVATMDETQKKLAFCIYDGPRVNTPPFSLKEKN